MEIVRFEDVKESIINNMRRSMLIPIIGSGLTRKCRSLKGVVPSGDDYRKYMLEEISQAITLSPDENEKLRTAPFSTVSEVYYESGIIPLDKQRCYLRDNFTHVQIEDYKHEFLSLPWPYIYTLNIDDGIEQSSKYNHVVHSNRDVDEHIFDEKNCVIKLHGDVNDMLTYKDANGTILTQKQYANSIRQHSSLLTKLEHDSIYENLIYNYLNEKELSELNPALTSIGAGLFAANRTIVDNIIHIGKRLEEDNKYRKITPRLSTIKEIATLIALSTEKKVYSRQVIALNLHEEMTAQVRIAQPLIDSEATWTFEKSIGDNSPTKYVINAEYWLYNVLSDFSIAEKNKTIIADAYEYIVKKIIEQY